MEKGLAFLITVEKLENGVKANKMTSKTERPFIITVKLGLILKN
jgi:hypothetical protein